MNAKKLQQFIEKATIGTTIPTFVVEPLDGGGTRVRAKSVDNTTIGDVSVQSLTVNERMPVKDARRLVEALKFVGGDVDLERKGATLFVTSKATGKLRYQRLGLVDEAYAKDYIPPSELKLEYAGSFTVSRSDLQDMASAAKSFGKESGSVRFVVQDGTLSLTTEGDTDAAGVELKVDFANARGRFGNPLFDVINSLSEDTVEVFISTDKDTYPMRLVERGEDIRAEYVIAPLDWESKAAEADEEAPAEDAPAPTPPPATDGDADADDEDIPVEE